MQCELEEAEERADSAENTLAKLRAKNRSSVSAQRTTRGRSVSVSARHEGDQERVGECTTLGRSVSGIGEFTTQDRSVSVSSRRGAGVCR